VRSPSVYPSRTRSHPQPSSNSNQWCISSREIAPSVRYAKMRSLPSEILHQSQQAFHGAGFPAYPTRKISILCDGRPARPENGARSETLGLLRRKTFQLANLPTCQRKARNEQVVFGCPLKVTSEDETLVTAAQVATELGCLRM
jgi:hypothetical protein